MRTTIDLKQIDTLRNLPDMIPVLRDFYEDWTVKVFNRKYHECRNYLSPNRREFYKVLFISKGSGVFTMGLNTYYIDEPTLLYIHPNDIISWKNHSDEPAGYYVLFKKEFTNSFPNLKSTIDKFALYTDKSKSVIRLSESEVPVINNLFIKMQEEEDTNGLYKEDSIQAYIQLLMVESMKVGKYPKPDTVTEEFSHVHQFFNLLETETSNINYNSPIRIRTAKEFAADLAIHPNYLNELLKKHTGQNASTHIRNRLLDEAKALLLQTDWNLHNISYSMGFSDQPNFSFFFKKNTGLTPVEFRKSFLSAKASA